MNKLGTALRSRAKKKKRSHRKSKIIKWLKKHYRTLSKKRRKEFLKWLKRNYKQVIKWGLKVGETLSSLPGGSETPEEETLKDGLKVAYFLWSILDSKNKQKKRLVSARRNNRNKLQTSIKRKSSCSSNKKGETTGLERTLRERRRIQRRRQRKTPRK